MLLLRWDVKGINFATADFRFGSDNSKASKAYKECRWKTKKSANFDVSLNVHLSTTLDNVQLNAQIFNTFITILYMYMYMYMYMYKVK